MPTVGSFHNLMAQQAAPKPNPQVGDGATLVLWTDRRACTVIAVSPSGTRITLQEDRAIRTDRFGMTDCQSYRFETDPQGRTFTASLRKDGRWIQTSARETVVLVGVRDEHYDYSF